MTAPKRDHARARRGRSAQSARLLATYAECRAEGMDLREAASRTGVHVRTAERYNQLLAAGPPAPVPQLPGPDAIPAEPRARDRLFASVTGPAVELAWIVRDGDPDDGAELIAGLSPAQQAVLPFVLAALVDVDSGRTPEQMLAWARPCPETGERVGDCWHCPPQRARGEAARQVAQETAGGTAA